MRKEMDAITLALAIQLHTSPRLIRSETHHSEIISGFTSVVPGCTLAVNLAGISIYDLLESVHCVWPGAGLDEHVDDHSMTDDGITADIVSRM